MKKETDKQDIPRTEENFSGVTDVTANSVTISGVTFGNPNTSRYNSGGNSNPHSRSYHYSQTYNYNPRHIIVYGNTGSVVQVAGRDIINCGPNEWQKHHQKMSNPSGVEFASNSERNNHFNEQLKNMAEQHRLGLKPRYVPYQDSRTSEKNSSEITKKSHSTSSATATNTLENVRAHAPGPYTSRFLAEDNPTNTTTRDTTQPPATAAERVLTELSALHERTGCCSIS